MTTNPTIKHTIPKDIQDKLDAYDRIRETQRKHSKAYISKIGNTDEYRKYQRDYYHQNMEKKQEQGRNNWTKYYNNGGKEKKAEYYNANRDIVNFKQSYRYYIKTKTLEQFLAKFPERYEKLVEIGFIKPKII